MKRGNGDDVWDTVIGRDFCKLGDFATWDVRCYRAPDFVTVKARLHGREI